jgi:hypothetical protein
MNLPTPFAYPTVPHRRRHGPLGYENYSRYKPFLRDEFVFRCIYCLERETWYPSRAAGFSSDHFEAKIVNPEREQEYENLVYACNRCNSFKGAIVVCLDPSLVALADHLHVREDGQIEGLTLEGKKLIALFDLAHSPAVEVREEALLLLRAKRKLPDDPDIHHLFLRRFGYPTDLPDLTKTKPPGGNSRPEGIEESHHARYVRGDLPQVY